ncbi:MAG: carotenoid biosynthesis protein [bacterium]
MITKLSEKLFLGLFSVSMALSVVYMFKDISEVGSSKNIFSYWFLLFPIILMISHSFIVLSPKRGMIFILIGMIVGTVMEHFGLKYGVIFGGEYVYSMSFPAIFTVPLPVVLFWPVFIYTSYSLVNSFLVWFRKNKPSRLKGNWLTVIFLVVCDGLLVTAIDLFMDPLQVIDGNWSWIGGGAYYGIPVGNFIGWFVVAFITSGLFRTLEYFFPRNESGVSKIIYLIPVLGYGTLSLFFTATAVRLMMVNLAIFGFIITMVPVMASIYIYLRSNILINNK